MHTVKYVLDFPTQLSGLTFLRQFFIPRACSLFKPKVQCLLNMGNHWLGDQLLSLDFSEIDQFLLYLASCSGRPVSAQLSVSFQNITPSIQKFTSWIESFWVLIPILWSNQFIPLTIACALGRMGLYGNLWNAIDDFIHYFSLKKIFFLKEKSFFL